MTKNYLLCWFLLGSCLTLLAQTQSYLPDSLLHDTDQNKASYFNAIAKQHPDMDSSLFFTHKAIELSANCDCDSLNLLSHYNLAFFPAVNGKFDLAIANISYLDSLLNDKNNLYYTYRKQTLLAYAYKMKGQLSHSLEFYKSALLTTEEMNDSVFIAEAHNNMGDAFNHMELKDEAKTYFLSALDYYENNDPKKNKDRLYIIYNNLKGVASSKQEVEYYHNKGFKLIQEEDNPQKKALFYLHSASAYSSIKKFTDCKEAATKALSLAEKIDFILAKNIALLYLAEANVALKSYPEAVENAEQALLLEQPSIENHKLILENLSKAYAALGSYQKAFDIKEKVDILVDSINSLKSTEAFAEFDVKFKTEQKDKEIAQQQLEIERQNNVQNSTIFGSIVAIILGISLFLVFYYRSQVKKRESDIALQLSEAEASKLRELDQLKSHFFTNISHELRTPLTLITGPLQEVLTKTQEESIKTDIKLAHSNSKKLLSLVNEILDLSKLESGKIDIKFSAVQLLPYLKRIFYAFESLAGLQGISLGFKYSIPENLIIKTDIDKFEKIINNLLSNAIKYNRQNGQVNLFAEEVNDRLQLTISDTGEGIAVKELPRIFNRYYQVSDKNTPMLGGTGVGLALARELAQLLGGDITVESEVGVGSRFLVSLPFESSVLAEKQPETIHEVEQTAISLPTYESLLINGEKPRLLIVEDNSEMSQYLKGLLQENYRCELAMNGQEGLDKVGRQNYDLILSDVMMPIMDGFDFKEQFNGMKGQKYTPFIMLTARALQEDRLKGFKLGVDDYITKPFEKIELIARVHNLIKNKIERQQWGSKNADQEEEQTINVEEKLLRSAEKIILDNLDNTNFKVTDLAEQLAYSQRQLARIIKKLTGMTAVSFILELRLQKAYQLLKSRQFHSVTEVMYEVGIESLSYFSTKFTERFGCNPKNVT